MLGIDKLHQREGQECLRLMIPCVELHVFGIITGAVIEGNWALILLDNAAQGDDRFVCILTKFDSLHECLLACDATLLQP